MMIAGVRVGRWTVLEKTTRNRHTQFWRCRCDCGTERELQQGALNSGTTHSCGCLRRELRLGVPVGVVHGQGTSAAPFWPEYNIWRAMRQRCLNTKRKGFEAYGGRGISICQAWNVFEVFLRDMGPRPSPLHSLDRIDNDGHYEPSNCRWATPLEQMTHTRKTWNVTHQGITLHVSEWERRFKVRRGTLKNRLNLGWTFERAVSQPVRFKRADGVHS